jgi:hypothetical protein
MKSAINVSQYLGTRIPIRKVWSLFLRSDEAVRQTVRWGVIAVLAATLSCAIAACSSPGSAPPQPSQAIALGPRSSQPVSSSLQFTFRTVDNSADPTFNRLLGINNEGRVGGYYGSGATGHPNRGYIVYPPYQPTNFRNENFPSAVSTQVTSLNNKHFVGGFYIDTQGRTLGFLEWKGIWFSYVAPHVRRAKPVTELLGLNDAGFAVGFYLATPSRSVAFQLNEPSGVFKTIKVPGAQGAVATGITGRGHIVGYVQNASSNVVGFLFKQGTFKEFSYPGSTDTRALAVTTFDRIVGSYVDGSGATHGFYVTGAGTKKAVWQTIDDPNATGETVVSGINIHANLVGYYVDSAGNNHGFIASLKAQR